MSPITNPCSMSPSKQVRFTASPPISAANSGATSSSTPLPVVPSEHSSSSTEVLPPYPLLAGPISPLQEPLLLAEAEQATPLAGPLCPLLAEEEQVTQAAGVPSLPIETIEPAGVPAVPIDTKEPGMCALPVRTLTLDGYVCLELIKVEAHLASIRDMLSRQ